MDHSAVNEWKRLFTDYQLALDDDDEDLALIMRYRTEINDRFRPLSPRQVTHLRSLFTERSTIYINRRGRSEEDDACGSDSDGGVDLPGIDCSKNNQYNCTSGNDTDAVSSTSGSFEAITLLKEQSTIHEQKIAHLEACVEVLEMDAERSRDLVLAHVKLTERLAEEIAYTRASNTQLAEQQQEHGNANQKFNRILQGLCGRQVTILARVEGLEVDLRRFKRIKEENVISNHVAGVAREEGSPSVEHVHDPKDRVVEAHSVEIEAWWAFEQSFTWPLALVLVGLGLWLAHIWTR